MVGEFVEFVGSGTYVFQRVPPEIDAGLREVEDTGGSVGRYFHHAIKTKFASVKLLAADMAGAV